MRKSVDGAVVDMTPVEARTLASIGYIEERGDLALEFTRGPVLVYYEVPENIYKALLSADLPDDYFEKNIRYTFKNKRVW